MDDARLHLLIQRHFDQVLTAEERSELSVMLLASPHARREFWAQARWNALIRQWGEAEWGRMDNAPAPLRVLPSKSTGKVRPASPIKAPIHFLTRLVAPTLAAAATILALFWISKAPVSSPPKPKTASTKEQPTVAVLARACDAVWSEQSGVHSPGETLRPGWLKLAQGAVQIEFTKGARVILEGPAEFQILSDNEGELRTGKIRAFVPEPAHGFLVRTREFSLTDLGTEFGCSMPSSGPSEVHVFNGQVAFEVPKKPEVGRRLQQSEALIVDAGKLSEIPARPGEFLDDAEFAHRELASAQSRLETWRKEDRLLSRHPATLLHFDFEAEDAWQRVLPNRARRAMMEDNATIIGCEWTTGRWPHKGALEFKRSDDRVRLNVPGLFESLSLAAWVRIDQLPTSRQALLATESLQPGEIHWTLDEAGCISLGIRVPSGERSQWAMARSKPIIQPSLLGSWIMLATVYDSARGRITHYLNGRPVAASPIESPTPLRLDTFEVGNCALRDGDPRWAEAGLSAPENSPRAFQGRIDEFAVLSVPLEPEEVSQIFDIGRPTEAPKFVSSNKR